MIRIKRLPSSKWKDYRDLRLQALKSDPIAFGGSYEEESKLPKQEWGNRIKNVLFAVFDRNLVGMIVCKFEGTLKTMHIANIFGVYVKKSFRGKGIGEKLLESAIHSIKKNKNAVKINLNVNPKQAAAVKLYTKYGFKVIGVHKKDLFVNEKFYDELIMEKFL